MDVHWKLRVSATFCRFSQNELFPTFVLLEVNPGACSGAVEARSPHNLETRVRSQTRCVFQFVKVSGHLLRAEAGQSHQSLGIRNRMFVRPSSSEQEKPT